MGVKWRDFQMPKRLDCDEATYTDTYGKFIAEPFEKGYGITLGNSLRRILLSSIEGSAVTSIKIDGIRHEYSTIPGVMESVSEIILNVKKLVIRSHSKVPKLIFIKAEKKGDSMIYYVDAGSNYIGKGVKTKLETAESVVKAMSREYSAYRFIPLEGRGAFGTDQSY